MLVQAWEASAQQLSANHTADRRLLERAGLCAKGFAVLVQVTKSHQDKQVQLTLHMRERHPNPTWCWRDHLMCYDQVLMQAIKCGGRFVEVFLSTAAFWHAVHDTDEDGARVFGGVAKDVQRAARVMQTLCSDAKSKKDVTLVAKVCDFGTG